MMIVMLQRRKVAMHSCCRKIRYRRKYRPVPSGSMTVRSGPCVCGDGEWPHDPVFKWSGLPGRQSLSKIPRHIPVDRSSLDASKKNDDRVWSLIYHPNHKNHMHHNHNHNHNKKKQKLLYKYRLLLIHLLMESCVVCFFLSKWPWQWHPFFQKFMNEWWLVIYCTGWVGFASTVLLYCTVLYWNWKNQRR